MKKAFTLIEFMIAITIVSILMIMTYAPYNYYSNKAKVRATAKDISQQLYDSRNLAIHGLDNGDGNVSIGVYFDSREEFKNKIQVFSFLSSVEESDISPDDDMLIKTIELKPGIEIDDVGGKENGFFVFEAISGDSYYYYLESGKQEFEEKQIDINFSYGGSDVLKNKITYFTSTNISDY